MPFFYLLFSCYYTLFLTQGVTTLVYQYNAVTKAEKELGSGTGQLKLRYVYNLFIERFGPLAGVITFDMLSILVDEALDEMKKLLDSNEDIEAYIKAVPKEV